jgi:hypothetical protein
MSTDSFTLKTTYEGEEILHRLLWQIAQEECERAGELERGWFNPSLVAMVFAFHTVEAYLNYVGERLAPEIWEDERNYFRKQPYRGWEGKLRKILEMVGRSWMPGDRPLKTVLELRDLRDLIAHGKPEKLSGGAVHPQGTQAPVLASKIRQMIIPKEKLGMVLPDVEQFLLEIHTLAAPKLQVPDIWFGSHPLHGPSEYTVHSTTIQRDG